MEEKKIGPDDGGNYYQRGDDEKGDDEQDEKEKSLEKDRQYNEELEELEKRRKEMEERKKEQKKKFIKKDEERKELRKKKIVKIGGQEVGKKVFDHNKGKEGIFDRRGKVKGYQRKIDKAFETKVHGVSSKKKKKIADFVKRGIKMESEARKKEVDIILDGVARKDFSRAVFKNIFKNLEKEGVDLEIYKKELEKINRRDIGKCKRVLGGGEDPHKHRIRPDSNRISNGASNRTGRSGLSSSTSGNRNRF